MASSSTGRSFSHRRIIYEPDFDLLSFKDKPFCNEGIKILNHPTMRPLFKLHAVAYPRIVRKFYETFHANKDDPERPVYSVTIDEVRYNFTLKDIADALGIKNYKPMKYKVQQLELINQLNIRAKPEHVGNKVRVAALSEKMWFVDTFLFNVLAPVMHPKERPFYILKFWHGVYKGKGLDVPLLMVEMIDKVLIGGRNQTKPHDLIYPRCITALMSHLGYVFRGVEMEKRDFEMMEYDDFAAGYTRMAQNVGLIPKPKDLCKERTRKGMEDAEAAERNQAQAEIDAEAALEKELDEAMAYSQSMPLQPHVISQAEFEYFRGRTEQTHTRIDGLYNRMDGLEENMEYMGGRMEEMYQLQRLSITRSWGDELANEMFTQAQSEAESSQPRRRTRRRPSHQQEPQDQGTSSQWPPWN